MRAPHTARETCRACAGLIIDEGGRGRLGPDARAVGTPLPGAAGTGTTCRPVVVQVRVLKGPDARDPGGSPDGPAHPGAKVPRRRETVKLHPHRPREAGGVCAGPIIGAAWLVGAAGWRHRERQTARRTHNGDGGTRRRRNARANVRGSGGEAALPQHGRPSRAPRRRTCLPHTVCRRCSRRANTRQTHMLCTHCCRPMLP